MKIRIIMELIVDDVPFHERGDVEDTINGLIGVLIVPEETVRQYRNNGDKGMYLLDATPIMMEELD